jgi:hypothetical protein
VLVLRKRKKHENKPNHIAKFTDLADGTKILEWRDKSGTNVFWFTAILRNGALCVFGDIGEAVYRWYPDVSGWEFFANTGIDYFESKCCASEEGRRYYEWDEQKAREYLYENFKDMADDNDQTDEEVDQELWKLCLKFEEEGGLDALYQEGDWNQWYTEHYDEIDDLLGSDSWEWAPMCGRVVARRCVAHLIGVQMALKQREEK